MCVVVGVCGLLDLALGNNRLTVSAGESNGVDGWLRAPKPALVGSKLSAPFLRASEIESDAASKVDCSELPLVWPFGSSSWICRSCATVSAALRKSKVRKGGTMTTSTTSRASWRAIALLLPPNTFANARGACTGALCCVLEVVPVQLVLEFDVGVAALGFR